MRTALLLVLAAWPALAGDKLLGNDTFTGNGSVNQGIDLQEYQGAGVLITPDAGDYPLVIKAVDVLCVPYAGQPANQYAAYLLDIWDERDGPLPPPGLSWDGGTHVATVDSGGAGAGLTSSLMAFNRISVSPPMVVDAGNVFVAVREQLSTAEDFTTLATDLGPQVPNANWYFDGFGNYLRMDQPDGGHLYGITGNWIIRLVLDVPGGNDGGTGGGSGGGGGAGGGAGGGTGGGSGGGSGTGGGSGGGGGGGPGGGPGDDGGVRALALTSITPAEGFSQDDTPVVLLGDGFIGLTEVLVGTRVITEFTVKSQNVAETTVKAGLPAGVYDVSVIDQGGNKATLTKAFTVHAGSSVKSGCGCDGSGVGPLVFGVMLLLGRRKRRPGA